jgi:hypothetical protein
MYTVLLPSLFHGQLELQRPELIPLVVVQLTYCGILSQ